MSVLAILCFVVLLWLVVWVYLLMTCKRYRTIYRIVALWSAARMVEKWFSMLMINIALPILANERLREAIGNPFDPKHTLASLIRFVAVTLIFLSLLDIFLPLLVRIMRVNWFGFRQTGYTYENLKMECGYDVVKLVEAILDDDRFSRGRSYADFDIFSDDKGVHVVETVTGCREAHQVVEDALSCDGVCVGIDDGRCVDSDGCFQFGQEGCAVAEVGSKSDEIRRHGGLNVSSCLQVSHSLHDMFLLKHVQENVKSEGSHLERDGDGFLDGDVCSGTAVLNRKDFSAFDLNQFDSDVRGFEFFHRLFGHHDNFADLDGAERTNRLASVCGDEFWAEYGLEDVTKFTCLQAITRLSVADQELVTISTLNPKPGERSDPVVRHLAWYGDRALTFRLVETGASLSAAQLSVISTTAFRSRNMAEYYRLNLRGLGFPYDDRSEHSRATFVEMLVGIHLRCGGALSSLDYIIDQLRMLARV